MNDPLRYVSIAVIALALAACGEQKPGGAAAPGGPPAMPPAEVGVVKVQLETVGITNELPGRVEASRIAQVRARAAGIVQKRLFREGSDVKAGQVLYQVDPAPFRATLDSALASVARAEANLAQAKATVDRYKPLVEANAVSRQDYANAVAAQQLAAADVAASRASVQTARINLGYATVTAPIAGRIGRTLVTEGALVGQGEATPLAVIQQIDPVYVNFTQSTSELMQLRRAFDSGRLKRAADSASATVRVLLDDGAEYPAAGRLLFSDLTVDQTSGQVTLRAEVPNPSGLLLPGMYVRVRLEQAQVDSAILLPQQAVTRNNQGDTVMVVDAEGKVAPRPVKLGGSQGNRWIVVDGLRAGEQVMVDGFQKLRPGAPVKPVAWTPPGSAPARAPAPAQSGGQAGAPAAPPATAQPAAAPSAAGAASPAGAVGAGTSTPSAGAAGASAASK